MIYRIRSHVRTANSDIDHIRDQISSATAKNTVSDLLCEIKHATPFAINNIKFRGIG
ncbi:hypothetical protein EVA_06957 [gut metagenome]|uniref:Uncharacterized protein n=1 Tax=gut metagenome TaxID=749906 RepID=J9GWC8_9ZZZZ